MSLQAKRKIGDPKYLQLAQKLRSEIAVGKLRAGARLPSFSEMRELHGATQNTVERVYHLLEQDGLIERVQGRGTFVLGWRARNENDLIGFCAWGYGEKARTPYWTHLLEGVQEVAAREQKRLVLLDPECAAGWDKVSGVLSSSTFLPAPQSVLAQKMPRVSLLYGAPGIATVGADNYQGARLASEHLIGLGHKRIACLGVLDSPLIRLRLAGYRDALETAGIAADARWVRPFGAIEFPQPNFRERGADLMRKWLRSDWSTLGCTALLAQNDLVAIGVMEALQEAGLRVPEDVSVVGFNGTEICDYALPRLSSVEVPLREIGALGMETLLREIESGGETISTTLLPTKLKLRDSTGAPATQKPDRKRRKQ